jgi:23S rRNA (uracil1939-C5)-methyltransferase
MSVMLNEQRASLVTRVERQLGLPVDDFIPSPNTTGYRARIELTPGADGVLGYRAPRSHKPIPVAHCPIARPEINAVLDQLPAAPKLTQRVALRSNGADVVLHAKAKDKHRHRVRGWLDELQHLGIPLALNGRGVHGDPTTVLSVGGISHRLSPSTFYQVNLEINARLVEDVGALVKSAQPTALLDLFSGAGNLSMPLVASGIKTTLIEAHPTAVKDARRTAERLGLSPDIREGRAEHFQAGDAFFDVAILDPPRKGSGSVIDQVLLTRPKAVILVSCNTAALRADLNRASSHGYSLSQLKLYEMFPHTGHVEAVGLLSSR